MTTETTAIREDRTDRTDRTENFRRLRLAQLNPGIGRAELEHRHGKVLDPAELAAAYQVVGFLAPFVVVRRKKDGMTGSLEFQHHPRFYFNWRRKCA